MKVVVKKFGGTSVGDVERIKNVARLIKAFQQANPDTKVVAVVSAMAGETNKLIALAKSCVQSPPPRELDVMVATGEQVTIALLAMALSAEGLAAQSMLGLQANISTDGHFTNAHIEKIDAKPISDLVTRNVIPVIAGFQGIDPQGNVTTLGRGGSDITAVAVAAALKADACYIYTDVEGVYSTDPRICRDAKKLDRVSHEEMLEMASLGAKVLHPRSVYFAMQYAVPLVVLSTFNPAAGGTWIVREEELMEKPVVTGITYRQDEARIGLSELKGGSAALVQVFDDLQRDDVFVDMITHGEDSNGASFLSFTVPEDAATRAVAIAERVGSALGVKGVALDRDIAKVSVVGVGMRYHTGVASKVFATLKKENIPVQMVSTSEIKISVIVPRKYCELAVRVLHATFIENAPVVSKEE